jgi:hypothetical protein
MLVVAGGNSWGALRHQTQKTNLEMRQRNRATKTDAEIEAQVVMLTAAHAAKKHTL